jgi:ABC-type spermidine/putrescine transport system permease subunit II
MPILGAIGVIILLVLSYAPSIWLVILSVLSTRVHIDQATFTLKNYTDLFSDDRWIGPIEQSAIIAAIAAVLATVVALIGGRAAGLRTGGVRILLLALVPALVPGVVMGTALFTLFRPIAGFRLGMWSILVGQVLWAAPFCTVLFFLRYRRFNRAWLDAAATLGLEPWKAFLRVELPILRSTIASSLIFGFILAFTELARSAFLRGSTITLPIFQWIEVSAQQSQAAITFGLSSIILIASSVVTVAIIIGQQSTK